jgi:serine/threonine-protein kinase
MAGRGDVLGGKYRLVERIGEGGMGTVWLARNEDLGSEVAVKLLHKILVGDASSIARFRNEARAAARIDHPSICSVIDMGEHDGAPFLVMERLRGESLADALARGPLPSRAAVEILVDVLEALEAAHAEGILHRDLKPENVFLVHAGERGVVKILDFGVAKFIGDDAERVRLTRTGALVGTPAYMSPEQARGLEDVDERSDVWAAGVLLYEMLSGRLPHEAPNCNAMLVAIATRPPRPLAEVVPGVDPALAAVVAQALALDPRERYASARAMADDLRAWLEGAPFSPRRPVLAAPHGSSTPVSRAEEGPRSSDGTHGLTHGDAARGPARRWLMPLVLGSVLGLAAVPIVRSAMAVRPTSPTTTAAAASVVRPVPPATVDNEVQLNGLPPGARVTVDGVEVRLPARIPRGHGARIEVTAPGFEPWAQTVTPTGDVALTYEGRRVSPVDAGAAPPSTTATPPVATPTRPGARGGSARGVRGVRRGGQHSPPLRGGVGTDPDF